MRIKINKADTRCRKCGHMKYIHDFTMPSHPCKVKRWNTDEDVMGLKTEVWGVEETYLELPNELEPPPNIIKDVKKSMTEYIPCPCMDYSSEDNLEFMEEQYNKRLDKTDNS